MLTCLRSRSEVTTLVLGSMPKPKSAALGMWIVAGLFVGVAIYGATKGRFSATLLAVAVVFLLIGVAAHRKQEQSAAKRSLGKEP